MRVYTASHGDFPIRSSSVDLGNLDVSGSVLDIIAKGQALDSGIDSNLFRILAPGGIEFGCNSLSPAGLPVCASGIAGNVTLSAGQTVVLLNPINSIVLARTRAYSDGSATDGSEIHLAFGQDSVTLASSVPQGGTLFFIEDGTFMTTQTPSAANIGFVRLQLSDCLGDRTPDTDRLICELVCTPPQIPDGNNLMCMDPPPQSPTCTPPQVLNPDTNMCEDPPDNGGQPPVMQPSPPSAATPAASQKNEADYATGAGIVSGVVGVILALHYWGGDANAFAFSPDYGYSITESGYAYNVGGRLDFRQDEWHLYYAAGQRNANGEFGDLRYESGGEYAADFWTAAFSETIRGDTTDWRFSLSAKADGGIWRLSPTYRFHSRLEDDETETRNSLNLEGVLRYNRWTISPSAGFNWRRPEEFGDNARFNLSAVRRF